MRSKGLALQNARIVGKPEPNWYTILICDGKIWQIQAGNNEVQGFPRIDLQGDFVMPGLIEMHGHFYGRATREMKSQHDAYCPLYLAGGITTVRTPGEFEPHKTHFWKQWIQEGKKIGPRIISGGSYFDQTPSIVGWIKGSNSEEELLEKISLWEDYVDFFKVYSNTPPEWIKLVADRAHALGKKVYGHLGRSSAKDAILAGIDGLEHGFFTMSEFYTKSSPHIIEEDLRSFEPEGSLADSVIELIVKHDVAITPTNITFLLYGADFTEWIEKNQDYRYLSEEAKLYHLEQRNTMWSDENQIEMQQVLIEKQFRFIERLHEQGARIFCGTDPSYPLILPGFALAEEAKILSKCGLSNQAILNALTIDAAKELGIDALTGSITVGKQADLIVLEQDPLLDLNHLKRVTRVFKDGQEYHPEHLRTSAIGKMS